MPRSLSVPYRWPSRTLHVEEHPGGVTSSRTSFALLASGYLAPMLRTLGSITRIPVRLVRPFSRLVLLALLWMNRHTIALWFRSLSTEVSEHGVQVGRLKTLVGALWRISNNHVVANAQALRSIRLGVDGYEIDARVGWPGRSVVEELLAPVPPYPTTVTAA